MKLSGSLALLAVLPLVTQGLAGVLPRQDNGANDDDGANGDNDGANGGGNNNNAGAGNNNDGNGGGDPQTSLTLDPAVIAGGFANDGQDVPTAGQVPSLTSTNNFINFCLTVPNLPITNGQQIRTGSCNPAPIGAIPSVDRMPSSKFTNPKNGDTIPSDEAFTISMAINNMETGNFVNAQQNYFAAPQQLNGQGLIVGHSHVIVEALDSLDQTTPTNPTVFAFFKGLNAAAQGGVLTADVSDGLPAGAYRLCSINAAANHQPVIVPVAQHGFLDDCVYFTATPGGAANNGNNNNDNDGDNAGANGGVDGGDNTGVNDGANDGDGNTGANGGANDGDNTGAGAGAGGDAGADNTGAGGGAGGDVGADNTGAGGGAGGDAGADNTGAGAGAGADNTGAGGAAGAGGANGGGNTGTGAGANGGANRGRTGGRRGRFTGGRGGRRGGRRNLVFARDH